jgi:hypothetical protein
VSAEWTGQNGRMQRKTPVKLGAIGANTEHDKNPASELFSARPAEPTLYLAGQFD